MGFVSDESVLARRPRKQQAARDECLSFFRAVSGLPDAIEEWRRWWLRNQGLIEAAFEPGDYELLRTGRLDAAAMILRRQKFEEGLNCRLTTLFSAPALSEAALHAIEQPNGARLPDDYIDFLLSFNGAHVEPGCFQCGGVERLIAGFLPAEGGLRADHPWHTQRSHQGLWPIAELLSTGWAAGAGKAISGELLVLDRGAVRLWRGDIESPVANSFRELLSTLHYPQGGLPWMRTIDNGDSESFAAWLETGPNLSKRDPASGFLPFEYLATAKDRNAYLGTQWADEEGHKRAVGRDAIATSMLAQGAPTGRAFCHAVVHGKYGLAERLLPLSTELTRQDLLDARSFLRVPGREPLLKAVEQRLAATDSTP